MQTVPNVSGNLSAALLLAQGSEIMSQGFMVPEYLSGSFYMVETREGTHYIPAHIVSHSGHLENDVRDYVGPGPIYSVEEIQGVGVRLSAPGYMDCTEWVVMDTEEECRAYVENTYDIDPDTGEPLIY